MTIKLSIPTVDVQSRPRITVFGVGGAGGNAVNNMIRANLEGVEFVVANTDAQALTCSQASKRVQLGSTITRGLGAGSRPDVGRAAAEEQLEEILSHLDGTNMAFITAGMGGGTGTGAAPVIARAAREQGILTVGVVTKPFHFEGAHRMRIAEAGIQELAQFVDTLIIIPNQNLFRVATEKTTFADAFKMADDVLHAGVRGVTDLMVMPGLINLDFADIRTVMTEMGKAMMGTGEADGDNRAIAAAEAAISNPLLDDVSMKGARGVLINITGGHDLTLFEVDEAANRIREEVDPEANIIFGSTFDQTMEGRVRVSVVATGIESVASAQPRVPGQPQLAVVGGRSPHTPVRSVPQAPAREAMRPAGFAAGNLAASTYVNLTPAPMPTPVAAEPDAAAMPAPLPEETALEAAPVEMGAPVPTEAQRPMFEQAGPRGPAAPQGPLRGERREGAFIPPRAADPGPRLGPATPDRYAAPGPDAKRPSLFQRMLGIGGQPAQPAPAPRMPAPAPTAPRNPLQTQPPVGAAAPVGPEAGARPKAPSPEEDHLDIPAFLRRQAN